MSQDEPHKAPLEYPQKTTLGDGAHTFGRTLTGLIPGGDLLNAIVTPPLQKRRDEFFTEVGIRLTALERAGFVRTADLSHNPHFVDAAVAAGKIAIASSAAAKRGALRNALLNIALAPQPESSGELERRVR
jgi:hypothetical protein